MEARLSGRMEALASLVTPGYRLADVGTDHGYIPIALVARGRIPSAIAMDVNEGPLERARENIVLYGLEDRIQTRLSDGLRNLRAGEADAVLIAGMGGFLVRRILRDGEVVLASVRELILQPQSEIPAVRRYLRESGYVITDEDMVAEDGKYYPMMRAERRPGETLPGSADREQLADAFGPVLLEKKHPVLRDWLERERAQTQKILAGLDGQPEGDRICRRKKEMGARLWLIEEALHLMGE